MEACQTLDSQLDALASDLLTISNRDLDPALRLQMLGHFLMPKIAAAVAMRSTSSDSLSGLLSRTVPVGYFYPLVYQKYRILPDAAPQQ